jgi:hypothetical protein
MTRGRGAHGRGCEWRNAPPISISLTSSTTSMSSWARASLARARAASKAVSRAGGRTEAAQGGHSAAWAPQQVHFFETAD